MDRVMRLCRVR